MPGTMKAMRRHEYGGPEVLRFEAVEIPTPEPGELLVRVQVASVNPADRYHMLGTPYLIRMVDGLRAPRKPGLGIDVAGTVQAVGADVEGFEPGDRVAGSSGTGYAEYALVKVVHAARLPDEVAFTEAAALPVAGLTALQGFRRAGLAAGQRVLVNGASGGVGHFAVQLAVAAGCEVTGVTSTRNLDLVRSLGAHDVIDYTTTDYTDLGRVWDVLFDNQGNHPPRANLATLADDGVWILINGPMSSRVTGPMAYIARATLATLRAPQRLVQFTATEDGADLAELVALVADGSIRPHIERTFALPDIAEAMAHLGTHRTRGKLLVEIP